MTQRFTITDHINFDSSGRAQCPCCLQDGKTGKNLSVTTSGEYEGAYHCFRGCSPNDIRAAIGQAKPSQTYAPIVRSTPNKKAMVSEQTIQKDCQTLLNSNGPAIQWLSNRGITREMILHFRLGIAQCKIEDKGKHLKRWGISIPLPTSIEGKFYRKKRVCPWDEKAIEMEEYRQWSQWGVPSMVYFTHSPHKPQQTWIVEGEWDAIMLGWMMKDQMAIAIATFTCGAGKIAPPDQLDLLEGRIVSFYDQNDKPTQRGTVAARTSEKLLHEFFGDRYQVGVPPMAKGETKEGYDVSDALNAGFTLDDFINAAQQSQPHKSPAGKNDRPKLRDIMTWNKDLVARAPDYVNWLIDGIITTNEMFVLAAPPRAGKSLLGLTLTHSVSTGTPFLGRPVTQGIVFYVHCEDCEAKIKERQRNQGWDPELPVAWFNDFSLEEQLDELQELIEEFDVRLVVLDTLSNIKSAAVSESSPEMAQLLRPLQKTATRNDCAILLIHHVAKLSADTAQTDAFNSIRGSTAIRGTCRGAMVLAPGENDYRLLTENGWKKEDLKVRLNPLTTRWDLIGQWSEAKNIPQKQQITDFLKTVPEATIEEIHHATGIQIASLYPQLARLQVSEKADEKVIKRGSRRNYTYGIQHQRSIELLNKVLNSDTQYPVSDTGRYLTKKDFSSLNKGEILDLVPDTTTLNSHANSLVKKDGTLCPESDTAENGPKIDDPKKDKVLNKGGEQGASPDSESDSAYLTTIEQSEFVKYRRPFRDDPKNLSVCQSRPNQGHFGEDQGHFGENQGPSSACSEEDTEPWVFHTEFETHCQLLKRNKKTSRIYVSGFGPKTVPNSLLNFDDVVYHPKGGT